ncbi:FadR/GntR family transcriptional regulator [Pseudomonas monteilii]|jgi:GntR family transcriptional repressor for pyruvate dehydrogenase complex|uniref:FadR/GntR family transcriptional regulator n=1 Tax=Pseudomonas alabamensis TaxID=3064349 RepID=UPI000745BCBB|nr:FadR/GntR family transcriptional regulator [Pseudomonas entomophila]AMA46045.1 GntR family transcriptional regulator [Pseudomonas monteilii]
MTEQQVQPRARRKPRSLAQELVTVLTERIRSGQLKRGDKLPTESQIMVEEGVSRTVVREAISRLQAAGQVETRHGIGTFVLDTPPSNGFRIDPATVVTLRDVLAVLELRIALEIESAGLAAERRDETHLAAMRAALDEINLGAAKASDAVAADFQFHLQIAQASGNHYFADILGHLGTSIIPRTRLNSASLAQDDQAHYLSRLRYEHEAIFEAIVRRDPEGAKLAMRMHLCNSRERLRHAHQQAQGQQPSGA